MNFGGSFDLFKKLGPKFEDEGLFKNQNYCFQVTNDVKLLEMMQWP